MKIIIQLSSEEEAKALPILLRHSPGMILPDRIYALGQDAVRLLRNAGIRFTQLSREALAPCLEEVAGERV
jgi:predicted Fe-Mo cluster-binding NifX family protein